MSLSSIELWQRIAAEGLASPMQCRSWAGEVSKLLPAAETADGLKVLQTLIDIGKLTKYQAKALAGQSAEPLKRGAWHVLSKVKHPLWQGWLEITKIDTSKGDQPPPRWARWLSMSVLNSLASSAPSLPRGIQLANIQAEHLQTVEMPELVGGELLLRVSPVRGSSLTELFASCRPKTEQVLQIIQQTASALAAMHARQVVHGRVTPDRIFWDDARGVTLVCDPISVWTAGVDPSITGILGEQPHNLQIASFLAPEFLAPRQPPSAGSDIYALGATWWWLLVGKPPFEGKSIAATLGAAAELTLDVEKHLQNVPEPLRICLERCLAKNPSARFGNASQLCQAIEAAVRCIAKGKNRPSRVNFSKPSNKSEAVSRRKQVATSSNSIEAVPQSLAPTNAIETLPKEGTPVQATPIQATPVQATPTQATPIQAMPIQATPVQATPIQATPIQATPIQATPIQATPIQATPIQAMAKPASTPRSIHPQPIADQPEKLRKNETANTTISDHSLSPARPDVLVVAKPSADSSRSDRGTATSEASGSMQSFAAQRPLSEANLALAGKKTSRRRTQRRSKMPLLIIAGFGFMALLLGILKLSGALDSTVAPDTVSKSEAFKPPVLTVEPKLVTKDPLLERFRIVDSKEALWVPPALPEPLALDLLPPGAQWYVQLRPAEILANKESRALYETLRKQFQLDKLLGEIVTYTGQPLESIATVVTAFYNAAAPEDFPMMAMRVELTRGQPLDQLKESWKATSEAVEGQEKLYVAEGDRAFFVPQDRLGDAIKEFSCGPIAVIKEAAEFAGAETPLNAQLKQLHGKSSKLNQLVLLGSPRYLFTEGRGLTRQFPVRLKNLFESILSRDARAALMQVHLSERCYWEFQLLGATDTDTSLLINRLSDRASGAAAEIEKWLVSQTPHPYWRALAIRYPQMIRTWREYARFGIEDGIGLANGYLPADAASNLLVGSWIATQEVSTIAGQLAESSGATSKALTPLSPEEILNKPIRLSFDQEPIERALALVGEEANSGVPAASQLRFELDGAAFERAGITRNQQLREFKINNQPARQALTDIAKRGNPVTTVKDTRESDQRLIWVVKDDPQNATKKMISLTTRDSAIAAGISLPVEFAPQ